MKTKEEKEVKVIKGKKSKIGTDFTVLVPKMPVSTETKEKMNTSGAGALNLSSSFYRRGDLTRERVKEYLWAVKLTAEEPTATWSFDEEDDDEDFLMHTLFLRHATLGQEAKESERNLVMCETKDWEDAELKFPICALNLGKSETAALGESKATSGRNIVEVESNDYGKKTMTTPICSLSFGQTEMCHLDLNFHPDTNVTFKLTQGTGPVHIVGQHMVEFPEEEEDIDEYNTEETMTEESGEEESDTRKVKVMKRKAKGALKSKGKRGKLDNSATGSEEDEEESEEDEDDEDEDEEDEEEDDEEDMEEDEEEEEEEEESPKKKPAKKGKGAKAPEKKEKKKPVTAAAKPEPDLRMYLTPARTPLSARYPPDPPKSKNTKSCEVM